MTETADQLSLVLGAGPTAATARPERTGARLGRD